VISALFIGGPYGSDGQIRQVDRGRLITSIEFDRRQQPDGSVVIAFAEFKRTRTLTATGQPIYECTSWQPLRPAGATP
jgi:hypothetical protein